MSYSIDHWDKSEKLISGIALFQVELTESHAVLDEYFGNLGGDLNLPDRLSYVLDRLLKEIKDLHEEVKDVR